MRIIYEKTTLVVVTIITDDDSSITAFPATTHCALQADPNTLIQMSIAIGLNLQEVVDHFTTNNIEFNMTPEQEQIFRDRAFGINFGTTLIDTIKNLQGMTLSERGQLLNKIHLFLTTLQFGDITVARAIMNSYAVDAILTQGRKDWVLAQLDAYINA